MGVRTYARFTIPMAALATPEPRVAVAAILDISTDNLSAILAQDPSRNDSVAGFANQTAVRLVDDVPCLVIEDDEANSAGEDLSDALIEAGIPFLRVNAVGDEYGPARRAFTGIGALVDVDVNLSGDIVVVVARIRGRARLDRGTLEAVDRYFAAEHQVLHGPPAPRRKRQRGTTGTPP